MPNEFKRIGLWGRFNDSSVAEPAAQLATHLKTRGIEVFAADKLAGAEDISLVPREALGESIDLLVAIGGDGNLLRATRRLTGCDVPLVGINRGRLGFLTDIRPTDMLDAIDAVLAGDYLAEQRSMLKARIIVGGAEPVAMNALNDVVLKSILSGRILDFETAVDGLYVNAHGGDGLIVATPTGSTAYALSCGGPIIRPDVDALVMVPICPHTLSDRPIVLQGSSTVSVRVPEKSTGQAQVTCDGEELGILETGQTLEIQTANESITLLHPQDYNYYDLLRSKLNWGQANRTEH